MYPHRLQIARMRKHYAFRLTCRTGRIYNGSQILRNGFRHTYFHRALRMRVIPQAQEIIKINGRLIFRIHLDRRIKDNQTLQILRVLLYLESVIILQLLTHEQRADLSVIDDVLDLSRRIRRVHRDGNHPVTIRTEVRI